MDTQSVISSVEKWLDTMVIGLNLCPFARREFVKKSIRFSVSSADSETQLIAELQTELTRLNDHPEIETTLLIHPCVLEDFFDYNNFLSIAERLILGMNLEGIYQIASFHPDYQFAGTKPEAPENYTNRSPYPLLHILREVSLEGAIDTFPDVAEIPEKNIKQMGQLGSEKIQALLNACYNT